MRRLAFTLIFLLLLVGGGIFFYFSNNRTGEITDPRIKLIAAQKNINGFPLPAELFQSEFLIVNFWASWCPPCIEETPSLIQFTKIHPEFRLVAFSQDDTMKDVLAFVKLFPNFKNAGVDVVFDESREVARKFNVSKLPETFIFNRTKNRYIQISGATNWADPKLYDSIITEFKK